jgi:hypothetical protein
MICFFSRQEYVCSLAHYAIKKHPHVVPRNPRGKRCRGGGEELRPPPRLHRDECQLEYVTKYRIPLLLRLCSLLFRHRHDLKNKGPGVFQLFVLKVDGVDVFTSSKSSQKVSISLVAGAKGTWTPNKDKKEVTYGASLNGTVDIGVLYNLGRAQDYKVYRYTFKGGTTTLPSMYE